MNNDAQTTRNIPATLLFTRSHCLFIVFLAVYALLLFLYPMGLQAMESYAYAAAAEGYYNLATTFAVMNESANIPNFSHYHPNHPLPHLIASMAFRLGGIPALQVFRSMNFAGTLVFLCLHYAIALRIFRRTVQATLATALSGVSYAVWASALSGEVQMVSLAFLLAGFYCLVSYFQAAPDTVNPRLLFAGMFYVIAVAFHQASFFAGIPAAVAALSHSRSRRSLWLYAQVASIVIFGWAFFYILLLVFLLDIQSLNQYLDTLFVYRHILARHYGSTEWFALLAGAATRSIAFADFGPSFLVALVVLLAAIIGFWNMFRSNQPKPVWILLAGLPIFQIGLQLAVRGRPEGINFWLFLIPCISIAVMCVSASSPAGTIFNSALVVLLALLNFYYFFLPNHRLGPGESTYVNGIEGLQNLPVAVVVHEPVLTFAEGWSLGSESGLRNQTWFMPCCGERSFEQKLARWINDHDEFLLLSDKIHEAERWLPAKHVEAEVLIRRRGTMAASVLPRSLYFTASPGEHYPKEILLVRIRHRRKAPGN
ncbi:MAG: hypothetical protein ACOY5B_01265 [Spirochaetota bacterium]